MKSDSSEIEKRVNLIYSMLLQGLQRKAVIQYCSNQWGVGERQVDTYLVKARELMSDDSQKDLDYKKSEILAQYYDLYNKSYDLEDYKECRNILANIGNILGVNSPEKIDLKSEVKQINIINLGDGE